MLRLIIILVLAIAVGLFISRLFSSKRDDGVIDGEVIDADGKPNKPNLLPILLLGLILAGVVFFVLPRFGINVIGIASKGDRLFAFDKRSSAFLITPKCWNNIFWRHIFFDIKNGAPT